MEWSDGAARARLEAIPGEGAWTVTFTAPDGAVRTTSDALELAGVAVTP